MDTELGLKSGKEGAKGAKFKVPTLQLPDPENEHSGYLACLSTALTLMGCICVIFDSPV